MFKQYSWLLNVLFILFVSFFASKITNVYLSKALEVKKSIGVVKTAEEAPPMSVVKEREDYDVITQRNIFDSSDTGEGSGEAEGGGAETAYVPGGEAVKTGLSIKVLAVLVIGEGKDKRSSATVDSGGKDGVDVYAVGEERSFSPGVKLVQVKPDRIEFIRGGRLEYAELLEDMGGTIFGPPIEGPVASKEAAPAKEGEAVVKAGEGKYVIDQREIDNALQNLDKLYTEIRAVPNFQDGRASGMKILSIKPGSVFAKLGLKRGDVLQKINGMELDVRKGFEIFSQLKDQKSLSLDLIRGGANQTVEYEIR
jgi:general secretion pathway protein C